MECISYVPICSVVIFPFHAPYKHKEKAGRPLMLAVHIAPSED